jgi:hypothetical protein
LAQKNACFTAKTSLKILARNSSIQHKLKLLATNKLLPFFPFFYCYHLSTSLKLRSVNNRTNMAY